MTARETCLELNAVVANPNRVRHRACRAHRRRAPSLRSHVRRVPPEAQRFGQLAVDARDREVPASIVDRNGTRRASLAVSPRRPSLWDARIAHHHKRIVKRGRAECILGVRVVGVDLDRRLRRTKLAESGSRTTPLALISLSLRPK